MVLLAEIFFIVFALAGFSGGQRALPKVVSSACFHIPIPEPDSQTPDPEAFQYERFWEICVKYYVRERMDLRLGASLE